jgi:hypothetical protein
MSKTVIGLFDTFNQAESAVANLARAGIARDRVSVLASERARSARSEAEAGAAAGAAPGAGVGATTGAVVGGTAGLLAGLGTIAIPGFGPLLAAGPLVALFTGAGIGAGVGAVAGGLIGALVNAGVPEEQARIYEESIRRGGVLVTVETEDDLSDMVADILDRHGAVDLQERSRDLGLTRTGATPGRAAGREDEEQARRAEAERRVRTGEARPVSPRDVDDPNRPQM